mmetsp:Transcript_7881/g.24778  ORF Transcript_7881/g.24778 Transcript_7881/m.24778 type:complete len:256 (-) Transcript_7881:1558-2325(-)
MHAISRKHRGSSTAKTSATCAHISAHSAPRYKAKHFTPFLTNAEVRRSSGSVRPGRSGEDNAINAALLFCVCVCCALKFVTDQRSVFIPMKSVFTMAFVSASSFSLSLETSSFTSGSFSSSSSFPLSSSSSSSSSLTLPPFLLLPPAFFFEDFFVDVETISAPSFFSAIAAALFLPLLALSSFVSSFSDGEEEVDGVSFFSSCKCSTNFSKVFNLGRKVRNFVTVASKIFTKRARASSALPGVVSARRRKIDSTK